MGLQNPKIDKYFEGLSNNDYHSDKEFYSSSQLKVAVDGHGSFRHYLVHGKEEKDWKIDNSMDWGSLVHCLLLEPHMLNEEFAFFDLAGRNMRTKVEKENLRKFRLANKGKIVVSKEALEKAKIAEENVWKHPFAKKLLTCKGRPEISGYFKHTSGLPLRTRPDRLVEFDGNTAIVDVKTTKSIDKDSFRKTAKFELHYDLSAAMYIDGHAKITGEILDQFYFLCVENVAPYKVAVYKASKSFLDGGDAKYKRAVHNVQIALGTNNKNIQFQEVDYDEI